jgi:hypothetical protein
MWRSIFSDLLHCFVMGTTAAILEIANVNQHQSTTDQPLACTTMPTLPWTSLPICLVETRQHSFLKFQCLPNEDYYQEQPFSAAGCQELNHCSTCMRLNNKSCTQILEKVCVKEKYLQWHRGAQVQTTYDAFRVSHVLLKASFFQGSDPVNNS